MKTNVLYSEHGPNKVYPTGGLMNTITYTAAEWQAKAERLYGADPMQWSFVCPSCGHIATVQDWQDAGAPQGAVAFACVGRWLPECEDAFKKNGGPCNYAGGGLIMINPVLVSMPDDSQRRLFDFAKVEMMT